MIGLADILPRLAEDAPPEIGTIAASDPFAERDEWIAQGRRQAEAARAEEIARLMSDHRAELALARDGWCAEQASDLSRTLSAQIAGVEERLADAIATVLQSSLTTLLPEAALRDMRVAVGRLARDDLASRLSLSGPPDLTARLSSMLEESGVEVASCKTHTGQVTAQGDGFKVVSHLEQWLTELRDG
jgi:hypothetical protein